MQCLLTIRLHLNLRKIIIILMVTIFFTLYKFRSNHVVIHWKPVTNLSCHYSREDDALPPAENLYISPEARSIFFHESSCGGGLNSRQACAVESAARAHPHWQVHLLFSSPVSHYVLNNSCLARLLQFHNIKITRIHINDYTKMTPITSNVLETIENSEFPVEYSADLLRFLTLNKWGGVYLDLDMVVVRSLESLPPNWIVKFSETKIATGIMSLAKDDVGSVITAATIEKMAARQFDPFSTFMNASQAFYKSVFEYCPGVLHLEEIDECGGLSIYTKELFYPVESMYWFVYFDARDLDDLFTVYTHHMWNRLSMNTTVDTKSPYARLARKYCPTIYDIFGDEFGT